MIRVMHLITGLNTGGAERTLFSLVKHSDTGRHGHSVVSVTDKGPVAEDLVAAGVPVHALGMRRGFPSLFGLFRLVRLLRQTKPDILQCWMYHANLLGVIAGKLAGVPHIVWGIRCSDMDFGRYRPLTRAVVRLNAWLSGSAEIIVVNSEAGKKIHHIWGFDGSKMAVISNGIDVDCFKPDDSARQSVRAELGVRGDTMLIGLMARFDPMKDHLTFFKAAAQFHRLNPGVHFLLAGTRITLENPAVSQLISWNNLEGAVHLLGPRDDIPRLTAALDIACLSSMSEAFPNVVAEAMACGVPCVVTAVGDAAYIVGDAGRVVPPRNPEAMSAAWAELIEMGPAGRHALGQTARQRIEENFTLAKMVHAYESLYGRIADGVRSQTAHSMAN